MAEPVLALHDLRLRYGALAVTDGVSLDVMPGGIHALIGPNGAGKTTLANLISGTVRPDAGTIRLDGRDITSLPMHRRVRLGLARSFQLTALLPEFSALENVALAVQARDGGLWRLRPAAGDAALNRPAMAALSEMGLEARAECRAGALSHGEKRQLELAVALATQPRVLLLDEPLAGTGAAEAERLIGILRRLRDRCTIILIEHDMPAVFALADRITVLVGGRVLASGTQAAIRADPAVQAAYLGEETA